MLSIDVGSKKVCVIEGSAKNGHISVHSCGEIEYESEVVVNGAIVDRPALSFLINEIINRNKMKSRTAIVTVNSSDIISREFTLPQVKEQSLTPLVKNEMIRIIGEDSNYIIDYVVTGVTEDQMQTVMAYAVPDELVEGYYTLLKEMKLKPFALDIQSNAMAKLLIDTSINGQPCSVGNIIIADIGYSKISFHGFSGGICRFHRTDLSPMQEFMREIGSIKRMDVTVEDIAQLDMSPDHYQEDPILQDTIKYFLYHLSEELQRYIQYICMNSPLKTVERIYLCGGTACIPGIAEALAEQLNTPVETIESIGKLSASSVCRVAKICNAAGALIRM